MERRDEVPRYHAGRRPISPHGPIWVEEGDPGLFDRHTSYRSPVDLCIGPLKTDGSKMFRSASSTHWKAIPMYKVTRCTKAHTYWRDFYRPTYSVCGC